MSTYNEYDVAYWKPVTPEVFISELAATFLTGEEPDERAFIATPVGDTGTFRLVLRAPVNLDEHGPVDEAYLMVLHDPETNKTMMFRRKATLAI